MEYEDLGYQPFLDDLESINQEFLLRNYTTVWLGCIDLLVKLLRLPSPQTTPQPSSPIGGERKFEDNLVEAKNAADIPVTLIERWKQLHTPPFQVREERHRSLFHLWVNIWSLLITVVGKETAVETTITSPKASLLGHSFTQSDIPTMENQLYSMERSLKGIWATLLPFYSPEVHTIPSDLILGLMLVAVKHQKFTFAETVAAYWSDNLPESWRSYLRECAKTIKWDELDEDTPLDGAERLCQHYDYIQSLYITHALAGQARWAAIPSVLRKDPILTEERKQRLGELVDQAYQDYEDSQLTLDPPPQSAAALASRSRLVPSRSNSNTLVTNSPDLLDRVKHWSRTFFHSSSATPALLSGVIALLVAFYLTRRHTRRSKSWGMVWLLRILRSVRPALPPTS